MVFDLHTHFLPDVDDGPKTLSQSLDILREASADGTQLMVATPHSRDVWERRSIPQLQEVFQEVKDAAEKAAISVQLYLGMENHLVPDLHYQVDAGKALPLAGTRYILVELPFTQYPPYTDEVLFALQVRGLVPVIAHPERNADIQRKPELLRALLERDILSQITGESIQGDFGRESKSSSRALLRQGLVHLIASDTHAPRGRRNPRLNPGVEGATKIVGEERARAMVRETPRSMLRDETVDATPLPVTGGKRFRLFGR